jgi:5'-nucleotidase
MENTKQEWYKTNLPKCEQKLEILHFNDVYNLESRPEGAPILAGAARFVTALNEYHSKDKLVLFSGDLLFPSNLSTYFEGKQMIMPFNKMNVDISCLGNHEIEIGIEYGAQMIK